LARPPHEAAQLLSFLRSTLNDAGANCTYQTLYPLERTTLPLTRGWVGPRTSPDDFENRKFSCLCPDFHPEVAQAIAWLLTVLCCMSFEAEITGNNLGRKKKRLDSGAQVF